MEGIKQFITAYNVEMIIVLIIAFIILLTSYFTLAIKMSQMRKRHQELVGGRNKINIEDILIKNGHEINDLKENMKDLNKFVEEVDRKLNFSVQRVGFIRYNGFGDMGTDLSYSIAFLDNFSNGFVLTSLYNRGDSTSYAKPIKNGKSIYPLSVEEMQSVDRAIKRDYASSF